MMLVFGGKWYGCGASVCCFVCGDSHGMVFLY